MAIAALAPWFGSNRMLGKEVGLELAGCSWVGVPFAGGMSELAHLDARSMLVNDLHRHVINLALVLATKGMASGLARDLNRLQFHPDVLKYAQEHCREMERAGFDFGMKESEPDARWALNYFVCCWMGRSSKSGTDDEFNGRASIRWNANGGDSNTRYRSALRSIAEFSRTMKRCTFEAMDAFEMIARCEDQIGHGIYCDPPFPGAGRRYKHNAGMTDADERAWHVRLQESLIRFQRTRIVVRFYDHEMIRDIYPEKVWHWRHLKGRDQANNGVKPEVLITNEPSFAKTTENGGLFA